MDTSTKFFVVWKSSCRKFIAKQHSLPECIAVSSAAMVTAARAVQVHNKIVAKSVHSDSGADFYFEIDIQEVRKPITCESGTPMHAAIVPGRDNGGVRQSRVSQRSARRGASQVASISEFP